MHIFTPGLTCITPLVLLLLLMLLLLLLPLALWHPLLVTMHRSGLNIIT